MIGLQKRTPNTSAGNWFQCWMVLFTKEYFPISFLCLIQLIFLSWSALCDIKIPATKGKEENAHIMQQNKNDEMVDWFQRNSVYLGNPAKRFCLIIFSWNMCPLTVCFNLVNLSVTTIREDMLTYEVEATLENLYFVPESYVAIHDIKISYIQTVFW